MRVGASVGSGDPTEYPDGDTGLYNLLDIVDRISRSFVEEFSPSLSGAVVCSIHAAWNKEGEEEQSKFCQSLLQMLDKECDPRLSKVLGLLVFVTLDLMGSEWNGLFDYLFCAEHLNLESYARVFMLCIPVLPKHIYSMHFNELISGIQVSFDVIETELYPAVLQIIENLAKQDFNAVISALSPLIKEIILSDAANQAELYQKHASLYRAAITRGFNIESIESVDDLLPHLKFVPFLTDENAALIIRKVEDMFYEEISQGKIRSLDSYSVLKDLPVEEIDISTFEFIADDLEELIDDDVGSMAVAICSPIIHILLDARIGLEEPLLTKLENMPRGSDLDIHAFSITITNMSKNIITEYQDLLDSFLITCYMLFQNEFYNDALKATLAQISSKYTLPIFFGQYSASSDEEKIKILQVLSYVKDFDQEDNTVVDFLTAISKSSETILVHALPFVSNVSKCDAFKLSVEELYVKNISSCSSLYSHPYFGFLVCTLYASGVEIPMNIISKVELSALSKATDNTYDPVTRELSLQTLASLYSTHKNPSTFCELIAAIVCFLVDTQSSLWRAASEYIIQYADACDEQEAVTLFDSLLHCICVVKDIEVFDILCESATRLVPFIPSALEQPKKLVQVLLSQQAVCLGSIPFTRWNNKHHVIYDFICEYLEVNPLYCAFYIDFLILHMKHCPDILVDRVFHVLQAGIKLHIVSEAQRQAITNIAKDRVFSTQSRSLLLFITEAIDSSLDDTIDIIVSEFSQTENNMWKASLGLALLHLAACNLIPRPSITTSVLKLFPLSIDSSNYSAYAELIIEIIKLNRSEYVFPTARALTDFLLIPKADLSNLNIPSTIIDSMKESLRHVCSKHPKLDRKICKHLENAKSKTKKFHSIIC